MAEVRLAFLSALLDRFVDDLRRTLRRYTFINDTYTQKHRPLLLQRSGALVLERVKKLD